MVQNMRDLFKAVYNKPEDTRSTTVNFNLKLKSCLSEYNNNKQHEASQFMRDTLWKLLEAKPEKRKGTKPKKLPCWLIFLMGLGMKYLRVALAILNLIKAGVLQHQHKGWHTT